MKYDYSKVKYVNTHTKVIIICPQHGEFQMTPNEHLSGSGCSLCSRNKKLTKADCINNARKYDTITQLIKNGSGTYNAAKRNGWIDECCSHMSEKEKKWGYWTLDKCIEEAKKYNTKMEWRKNNTSSYSIAHKNGWIDKCTEHMANEAKFRHWTLDKCIEEAKKYNTKSKWLKNSGGAYDAAYRNGWIDECCQHMTGGNIKWTLDKCIEEAKKYNTKTEWRKNNNRGYDAAHRNGWIDECCQHMIELLKPNGYWTLDKCINKAKKYNTKTEWLKNNSSSYHAAKRNGWIDKCCQHMVDGKIKWTFQNIKKFIVENNIESKGMLKKKNESAYNAARRNGWIDECCKHMNLRK